MIRLRAQVAPGWVNPEFMRGFTFDTATQAAPYAVGASSLGGVNSPSAGGGAKENQVRRVCAACARAVRRVKATPGHRVSRPRGTGSVDDSVGEGVCVLVCVCVLHVCALCGVAPVLYVLYIHTYIHTLCPLHTYILYVLYTHTYSMSSTHIHTLCPLHRAVWCAAWCVLLMHVCWLCVVLVLCCSFCVVLFMRCVCVMCHPCVPSLPALAPERNLDAGRTAISDQTSYVLSYVAHAQTAPANQKSSVRM